MTRLYDTSSCAKSSNHDPDAELLAYVQCHDDRWHEWNKRGAIDEEDPRIDALSSACSQLELWIVTMRPVTPEGLAAWLRVVDRAEFDDANGVIAALINANVERVAAAR